MIVKTLTTTEAQKNFGNLVINAINEPIAITKHMKEVFVIVPSEQYHKMKQFYDVLENKTKKQKKAGSYIGSAKGLFASSQEVDEFILKERESWK